MSIGLNILEPTRNSTRISRTPSLPINANKADNSNCLLPVSTCCRRNNYCGARRRISSLTGISRNNAFALKLQSAIVDNGFHIYRKIHLNENQTPECSRRLLKTQFFVNFKSNSNICKKKRKTFPTYNKFNSLFILKKIIKQSLFSNLKYLQNSSNCSLK